MSATASTKKHDRQKGEETRIESGQSVHGCFMSYAYFNYYKKKLDCNNLLSEGEAILYLKRPVCAGS
jgi:hypothetical protein